MIGHGLLHSERAILLALALLAALRVGLYATLFPMGANVDEIQHYDVVVRWSQGHPPRQFAPITRESAAEMALVASPEFISPRSDTENKPPSRLANDAQTANLAARAQSLRSMDNHELLQPPLYYATAGAWRATWQALGVPLGGLAYGVRLLNVFIIFGTVLVAGAFARRAFPHDRCSRLAVPALVAVMPQDALYCINNDVLSALLVGSALVYLLDLVQPDGAAAGRAAKAGTLAACALMSKLANIFVMAPLAGAALLCVHRAHRNGWPRRDVLTLAALSLATLIPLAVWMLHNWMVFGDLTGGAATARASGWTPKPLSAMLDHPLFSPGTAAGFLTEIVRTTWRGELVWHGVRLAWPWVDALYVAVTALLLTGALLAIVPRFRPQPSCLALVLPGCWLTVLAGVGFLAFVSVAWDFGNWFYPSRAYPLLPSGRLILGALVPLATLCAAGLAAWSQLAHMPWARGIILVGLCGISLVSEWILTLPVLGSEWNAYHFF